MKKAELEGQIVKKKSFLCIGLDPDPVKMPPLPGSPSEAVLAFNKSIIEATEDLAVAYKPNFAFYEALGTKGWDVLEKTVAAIPKNIFKIADAKRGDIGNTSSRYAKAIFEELNFDAVTVAPYMGRDSIEPFLEYKDKWTIVLALTSNAGSADFQRLQVNGKPVYEFVLEKCVEWGSPENLMFVIGATHPSDLAQIRKFLPDHFLLVPGVGAQGGDLQQVAKYGMNDKCGLLVNASRSVLYAGNGSDYANRSREEALKLQMEMATLLENINAS